MAATTPSLCAPQAIPARPSFAATLATLVRAWIGVARQRRALALMDARLLRDIGLTREAAMREAGRPFWDLPQTGRRHPSA